MRLLIDKKIKIFIYVIIFFLVSTVNNLNILTNRFNFFDIKIIDIKGVEESLTKEIYNSLSFLINKNIFFLDQNTIEKNLNKFNFIEKYEVFREFPSFLSVKIEKTELVAIKIKENKKYYIGKNGKLIDFSKFESKTKLPYAFGNFSEEEFFSFLEILRINKFNINDVKNYYYFANKRWDLKLHNDTLIKFPQKNLDNFVLIAKSIIKNKNFNKKKVIDLRIPNQVIISYE